MRWVVFRTCWRYNKSAQNFKWRTRTRETVWEGKSNTQFKEMDRGNVVGLIWLRTVSNEI